MRKCLLSLYVGASALYLAGAAAADETRNCADTFQTPEFQALDLREPYGVAYLLDFLGALKGQVCSIDQLEVFFNAKYAVTGSRDNKNIVFVATLRTSTLLSPQIVSVGARIESGTITVITAGMEGF